MYIIIIIISVCLSVSVATVIVKHHKPEATGAAKTTGNQSVCDRQSSTVDRQDPPCLAVGGPPGKASYIRAALTSEATTLVNDGVYSKYPSYGSRHQSITLGGAP